jgi:hypothetical protein
MDIVSERKSIFVAKAASLHNEIEFILKDSHETESPGVRTGKDLADEVKAFIEASP